MKHYIREEMSKASSVIDRMVADDAFIETVGRVGAMCAASIRVGGKVMFCGNGGSAGDCQHLAAEMVGKLVFDRPGMAGLALTTDSSALTAIGNDFGYEHVFARQVQALGRPGDVLIGISTSGRSKNIVNAMETARALGIGTIAMTGSVAGAMSELADEWIAIPHTETQKVQEGHIIVGHIFCALVEAAIHGDKRPAGLRHMAEAVVLAGGLGTRLRGVVPDLPKPLAPVAGRPFLGWLLPHLISDGVVDRIILSIGYRGDAIEAAIGRRLDGIPIDYVRETVPLGTGGALRQALRVVEGPDAIVANGDTFADCDMRDLMDVHHRSGRPLTLALARVAETARYGHVTVDGSRVTGFASKGGTGPGLINAGIYAMRTDLLHDAGMVDPFSFEGDFMVPAVHQIQPAFMRLSGRFIDIGVPEDFAAAQTLFPGPLL